MGTHPIFESDFDCLTDIGILKKQNEFAFFPRVRLVRLRLILIIGLINGAEGGPRQEGHASRPQ